MPVIESQLDKETKKKNLKSVEVGEKQVKKEAITEITDSSELISVLTDGIFVREDSSRIEQLLFEKVCVCLCVFLVFRMFSKRFHLTQTVKPILKHLRFHRANQFNTDHSKKMKIQSNEEKK